MKEEDFRRLGGIAGGGVFILSLPILLLRFGPAPALLTALAGGLVAGTVVYLGGALLSAAGEPRSPAPPEQTGTGPSPDETRNFGLDDIAGAGGLDQTIRLDPGTLNYVVPELSPEQVLKDREGLDMDVIQQGIEGSAKARENLSKGDEQGGQ